MPAKRGSCDDDPAVGLEGGVGDAAVREGGLDPIVAEERIQYAGVGPCDSPDEHHDERDGDERGTAHVGLRPPLRTYGTILEIGSSRMSVAPAAFSCGISVFTRRFSTTVSIA